MRAVPTLLTLADEASTLGEFSAVLAAQGVEIICIDDYLVTPRHHVAEADRTYENVTEWPIDEDWVTIVASTVRLTEDQRANARSENDHLVEMARLLKLDWSSIIPIFLNRASYFGPLLTVGGYLTLRTDGASYTDTGMIIGAAHSDKVVFLDPSDETSRSAASEAFADHIETWDVDSDKQSALRQLRWEEWYEGRSVDIYDAKYHDGACYVDLDRALGDLTLENLPRPEGRPARLLDLGCGPGSMISFLQGHPDHPDLEITGVDISPAMIRLAEERHPECDFRVGTCELIPFDDGHFDGVLVSGMLHHLPNLFRTLSEIERVLAPGGVFVAREPNSDNFAHRQPAVSYAHLALRSLLMDVHRTLPIYEPDSHDDHIDFLPGPFISNLATVFQVTSFESLGRVSYFYERVPHEAYEPLRAFESDLDDHPGLNLMTVAVKAEPGRDPSVEAALERLPDARPVPAAHVLRLGELVLEAIEQRSALPEHSGRSGISERWNALGSIHQVVNASELADSTGEPIYPCIETSVNQDELTNAVAGVAEHGWLLINLCPAGDGEVATPDRALAMVAAELDDDEPRLLLRPSAIPPVDALRAARRAVDEVAALGSHSSEELRELTEMRARLNVELALENFRSEPSANETPSDLDATLNWLVASRCPLNPS